MAALALTRENFVLHKLQSLTGIVPVGFYMVQHLLLNSFALAGEDSFNGVISFFDSIPPHVLLLIEAVFIWIPLLFHAIYGVLIIGRAKPNFLGTKYGWSQNRMYFFQRVSGIVVFFFLIVHYAMTTGSKYLNHTSVYIQYAHWHQLMSGPKGIAWMLFYLIGVLSASYHLGYGIWNFCIRWGITIGEKAQIRVQQFSLVVFVALTVIGWATLFKFMSGSGPNVSSESPGAPRMGQVGPKTTEVSFTRQPV
ncbi:MAG TPA: hypothetical protein VG944_10880 [Fimbriimonas sp.]|nr:hypothetical protein [Fimbriimonas sp.]